MLLEILESYLSKRRKAAARAREGPNDQALKELFRGPFADAVKELPNPFEYNIANLVTEDRFGELRTFCANHDLSGKYKAVFDASQEALSIQDQSSPGSVSNIAARIWGHDLNGIAGTVLNGASLISSYLGSSLRYFAPSYTNFHIFTTTMVALVEGMASKCIYSFPTENLKLFLGATHNDNADVSIGGIHPNQTITNVEYVALWQAMKNAYQSEGARISIDLSEDSRGRNITVQDYGTGLVDAMGQPLSRFQMPKVFGEYTTKNTGGLGLQVIREITELCGGSVELRSRAVTVQSPYSVKPGQLFARRMKGGTPAGLQVRLYFPR